jgi:biopolymer transport protein ExbD
MKLHSPLPHRKARIEIIPLIDIMFFLLASFMLVSLSMIRMKGVKMTLPQAASATAETDPDFVPIGVSPSGELSWGREKTPLPAAELTPKIAALFQVNPELRIFINADRDATHGTVIDVLDRVRQAGVTKVSFAIKPGTKSAVPELVPAPSP